MMRFTFGLFTQVIDSEPYGPLDSNMVIKLARTKLNRYFRGTKGYGKQGKSVKKKSPSSETPHSI